MTVVRQALINIVHQEQFLAIMLAVISSTFAEVCTNADNNRHYAT